MNRFRLGVPDDIPTMLPMMREFYTVERLAFDPARSERLLTMLIGDPRFGRLVLIESGDAIAGYMILGFGFSLEFGGRDAFIDELFVLPQWRGRGLGTGAVEYACELCRVEGMESLHLEADHSNERAHKLYLGLGFRDHERHLMSRKLQ